MTLGRILRCDFAGESPEWDCKRSVLRHSPPSCNALGYFKQALSLLPNDYRTHCYAVRAAYVLSVPEPLNGCA
jgi:hypothetical protein